MIIMLCFTTFLLHCHKTSFDFCADVAFNWIDNTLYWTMDDVDSGIYMVSLATRSENTVIDEDINKPHSIVVQPFNKYVH